MPTPVILHISDTHRTKDEPVKTSEILIWLERDIEKIKDENIPLPNVIVVSGDLVQSAEAAEYTEALELLRGLAKHLNINPQEIVVVPGNHDIHWPTAEKNARIGAEARIATFEKEGLRVGYPNEGSFQDRLQNFRTFYKELKGKDYPGIRTEALTSDILASMNLEIFGFSSVDNVHQYACRASIDSAPIHRAILQSKESLRRAIAVWHHDLDWISGTYPDSLSLSSLKQLSTGRFLMGLCGHTHRPAINNVVQISGYDLQVLSAGSLCAGPRQRPESVARSYNIIQLNKNAARVWARIKKEKDVPWEGCWDFGTPTDRRPWFDIVFGTDASSAPLTSVVRRKPGTGKSPNPFSELNAKSVSPSRIGKQYVPTIVSNQIRHDLPQILLGSRGTGKTALLYTLTLEAQHATRGPGSSFGYVGLYCAMKTSDVSAFNGKGWMLEPQREILFSAFIAALWSLEMVKALERLSSDEKIWLKVLTSFWGLRKDIQSSSELRQTLMELRNRVLGSLNHLDKRKLSRELKALGKIPLLTKKMGALESVAAELGNVDKKLEEVRWLILFDEVEFLNHWQQRCVYSYISYSSNYASCKIATLPYAHLRALEGQNGVTPID